MTMTWIAAISLGVLILGLLLAPALEANLTERVTNPLLATALLLAISLMLSNAAAYAGDDDVMRALGILSGILVGLGLFIAVLGCARFAMTAGRGQETGSKPGHPEN